MEDVARRAASVAALAIFAALAAESSARASDAEVTSDTSAQFYDVRSPTGQTVLMRRRLTSTLGVGEYNILDGSPADPSAPQLDFRARLRYDADYGVSAEESSVPPSGGCSPAYGCYVPGVAQNGVDLMYAYFEGRRFFKGLLGFKVGRQYQTDVLGWWSFDGGELSVTLPAYVKGEVYAGFEQRGGLPLSTSRFEADGVWRGDRNDLARSPESSAYPAFQPSAIAPAIGVALETTGVTWIHGRLSYRRVYDTGSSNVTEFASGLYAPAQYGQGSGIFPGMRTSSDRLGYAVDSSLSGIGGVKAGIIYDFYRSEVTSAYANLDAYFGTKVTVGLDYDYYVPSFDADSIWNFFAGEPHNDFGLRGTVDVDKKLSVAANAHARMFTVQTAEFTDGAPASGGAAYASFPSNGHPFDEGGDLSARWRTEETKLGLNARGDFGDEGDRVGADASAQHVFESRYVLAGRVGVWTWDDKLQPDRSTTSVQGVASVGYRFMPRSQGSIEGECDDNRIAGVRFRLMLQLSLGLTK